MSTTSGQRDVVILIDGDHIDSDSWSTILTASEKMGKARTIYAFGKISEKRLKGWLELLAQQELGMTWTFPSATGYNATDMQLTLGAVDLAQTGKYTRFLIVSRDKTDYRPLLEWLSIRGFEAVQFMPEEKQPAQERKKQIEAQQAQGEEKSKDKKEWQGEKKPAKQKKSSAQHKTRESKEKQSRKANAVEIDRLIEQAVQQAQDALADNESSFGPTHGKVEEEYKMLLTSSADQPMKYPVFVAALKGSKQFSKERKKGYVRIVPKKEGQTTK